MPSQYEDLAYYLAKAEDYRQKAKVVHEPRLRSALEAVARAYMAKAQEINPDLPSDGKN